MPSTNRDLVGVFLLTSLVSCSIFTAPDTSASVDVDPTVVQAVYDPETDETVTSERVGGQDEIECLQEVPRQCHVWEFVRATIYNGGERTIEYLPRCGGPLQHHRAGAWTFVSSPVCLLRASDPVEIGPGDHHPIEVRLPAKPRGSYRVVVLLYDEDGALSLSMRASEPFQLEPR